MTAKHGKKKKKKSFLKGASKRRRKLSWKCQNIYLQTSCGCSVNAIEILFTSHFSCSGRSHTYSFTLFQWRAERRFVVDVMNTSATDAGLFHEVTDRAHDCVSNYPKNVCPSCHLNFKNFNGPHFMCLYSISRRSVSIKFDGVKRKRRRRKKKKVWFNFILCVTASRGRLLFEVLRIL